MQAEQTRNHVETNARKIISVVVLVAIQYVVLFVAVSHRERGWLTVLAVLLTICAFVAISQTCIEAYRKRVQMQEDLLSRFDNPVQYVRPTEQGWMAVGEDWIATSDSPHEVHRIAFSDFKNFAWGQPNGRYFRYRPDSHFSPPSILTADATRRHWIFIPCASDPENAILAFFNRESEVLIWKDICAAIIEEREIEARSSSQDQIPKAAGRSLVTLVAIVYILLWFVVVLSAIDQDRFGSTFFVLFLGITGFPSWNTSDRDLTILAGKVRLTLVGIDFKKVAENHGMFLQKEILAWIVPRFDSQSQIGSAPVDRIGSVTIQDRGESLLTRDLSKLLSKNIPSKKVVLCLTFKDPNEPAQEIELQSEVAQRWNSELNQLIKLDPVV